MWGARPGASKVNDPGDVASLAAMKRIVPDETLLFHYSALGFNSHRIHLDRDFARQAEGADRQGDKWLLRAFDDSGRLAVEIQADASTESRMLPEIIAFAVKEVELASVILSGLRIDS
jgi:hypothetical protein